MPMNFHDPNNRSSYSTRKADESWMTLIKTSVDVKNKQVADIGCGGGIYTKALIELGAGHVTGIDFSDEMLIAARKNCAMLPNTAFLKGNAYHSTLPEGQVDIVLERALIHHLNDLNACLKEANRIMKKDGVLIIQDRTPEDCLLPGDENHIRGFFFEKYPKLATKEVSRRYDSDQVQQALLANGFRIDRIVPIWETRRRYSQFGELREDLLLRTGRSILHELTDDQLRDLISFIQDKLSDHTAPIVEKDSWTLWFSVKE
ncbi:class I SAM-dependent methyltransferase [Paenibacillus motobuensis]|uniref:Class I SAM-dependent methyltransferase n=1 Tax=Paenibacillus motobuensis TaxID=295324 RepID=A0ABN0XXT6_9BACL